jgi:hypothetical protein
MILTTLWVPPCLPRPTALSSRWPRLENNAMRTFHGPQHDLLFASTSRMKRNYDTPTSNLLSRFRHRDGVCRECHIEDANGWTRGKLFLSGYRICLQMLIRFRYAATSTYAAVHPPHRRGRDWGHLCSAPRHLRYLHAALDDKLRVSFNDLG